jgi:hypothetical protein
MMRFSRLIRSLDRLFWRWSLPKSPEIEAIDRQRAEARKRHAPTRHLDKAAREITHANLRSAR